MTCILATTTSLLAMAVAPHTEKINNINKNLLERGGILLQNGTLHLDQFNRRELRLKVNIWTVEKQTFMKGPWHLKG